MTSPFDTLLGPDAPPDPLPGQTPAPSPAPAPDPDPAHVPLPGPLSRQFGHEVPLGGMLDDQQALAVSAQHGLVQDPKTAARAIQLSDATGMPASFIADRLPDVEAAIRQRDFNPADFMAKSPVVGKWLSEDPSRVGLTRNDLPQLTALEQEVRSNPQYQVLPDGSVLEDQPGKAARWWPNLPTMRRALMADDQGAQDRVKAVQDALGRLPMSTLLGSAAADWVGVNAALERLAGPGSYTTALGLTGGDAEEDTQLAQDMTAASVARSPGAWGMVQRQVGALVAEAPLMMSGGVLAKAAQGVSQAVGMGRALSPLVTHVLTGAAAMQPQALAGAIQQPGGIGDGLTSWAIDTGIAGAFGPVGASRYFSGLAGAKLTTPALTASQMLIRQTGLQGGQMALFSLAHRIQAVVTGEDPTALDAHNLLPDLAIQGALGGMMGSIFTYPEAVRMLGHAQATGRMQTLMRSAESLAFASHLDRADDLLRGMESPALNQEAIQDLVGRMAQTGAHSHIYIDPQAWQEHFAASGDPRAPEAAAQTYAGSALAYHKALSSGQPMAIPYESALVGILPSEHGQWFKQVARERPDAMNTVEREAALKELQASQQAAQGGEAKPTDADAARDLVHEDFHQQLVAAGMDASSADATAKLYSHIIGTLAERTGMDPLAFHEQFGTAVRREIPQALRGGLMADRRDILIQRLKANDIPTERQVKDSEAAGEPQPGELRSTLLALRQALIDVGADVEHEPVAQLKERIDRMARGVPQELLVDGAQVIQADVPYAAGTSRNGKVVYIDRRIPRFLEVNGKRVDVHTAIAKHELAEHALMNQGQTYAEAHPQGIRAEHEYLRSLGVDTEAYEKAVTPLVERAKREAKPKGIPRDLNEQPYRDMKEEHLLEGRSGTAASEGEPVYEQAAYHGTGNSDPYKRFDIRKVGGEGGEGAQAYGHGLYFAGKKEVAQHYREKLGGGYQITTDALKEYFSPGRIVNSYGGGRDEVVRFNEGKDGLWSVTVRAVDNNGKVLSGTGGRERTHSTTPSAEDMMKAGIHLEKGGRLYHVEIPEDHEMLSWDRPLRLQTQEIQEKIAKLIKAHPNLEKDIQPGILGEGIYRVLSQELSPENQPGAKGSSWTAVYRGDEGDRAASEALRQLGIPGIRYLDNASRDNGDGTHNYVIFDDKHINITHYEQGGDVGPRGRYFPAQRMIELNAQSDRTTALHEIGHWGLETLTRIAEMPNAPQSIRDDVQRFREMAGLREGEAWTEQAHEMFAREWERYLLRGTAPTPTLRQAFARFSRWIARAYEKISGYFGKGQLNPELAAIFDRLVATDREIEAAKSEAVPASPFASAAEAGMTDEQWTAYQDHLRKGVERAYDTLAQDLLDPIREQEQASYQQEREKVRAQTAERVNRQPVYRAIIALQKGAWPVGEEIPEGLNHPKLSKADIEQRHGKDAVHLLPGPRRDGQDRPNAGKRIVSDEPGALTLDQAAEVFRFPSGDDLWHALINAQDRQQVIEQETEAHMRERFPDPLLDGTAEDKARAAIINDPRMKALEMEAEAIARKKGRAATPDDVLRVLAQQEILGKRAHTLYPELYRTAMVKAGKTAVDALARARAGDEKAWDDADTAKRQERLNAHLYRFAKQEARASDANRTFLQRFDRRDVRERIGKAGGDQYVVHWNDTDGQPQSRVFDALDHVEPDEDGVRRTSIAARRAAQDLATAWAKEHGGQVVRSGPLEQIDALRERVNLSRTPASALERRENLRQYLARLQAEGKTVALPASITDALGTRSWGELTFREQRDLADMVRNIAQIARDRNKALAIQREQTLAETRGKLIAHLRANAPKAKPVPIEPEKPGLVHRFLVESAQVQRLIREWDGFKEGGAWFDAVRRPILDAQAHELEMQGEYQKALSQLAKDHGISMWKSRRTALEPGIGPNSEAQHISRWTRMMMALNWGNADNRNRLLTGHKLSEEQVHQILHGPNGLTKQEWGYVQGVFDLIDRFWPEIKARMERTTGVAPEKVDALPIDTRWGRIRGGYFPIRYDPASIPPDELKETMGKQQTAGARLVASTRAGHTKERTGMRPDARLLLEPHVISDHITQVAHDLAFHETVRDLNALFRDRDMRLAVSAHAGEPTYRMLQDYIEDVAVGTQESRDSLGRIVDSMRVNMNLAHRGINLAMAVQQLAGFPQALARVGPVYFMKSLGVMLKDTVSLQGIAHYVESRSVMMANRSSLRDKNVADIYNRMDLTRSIRKDVASVAMWPVMKAWEVLDNHTWIAAFLKAQDEGHDEAKAARIADDTMVQIQGSGAITDASALMRDKSPYKQILISNMSWANSLWNMSAESVNRVRFGARTGDWTHVGKGIGSLMVLYGIMPMAWAAVQAALTGEHRKDIGDPSAWAGLMAKEGAYTVASSLPYARDLASLIEDGAHAQFSGPQGLSSMPYLFRAMQRLAPPSESSRQTWDEKLTSRATVKAETRLLGSLLGLPTTALWQALDGIDDAAQHGRSAIAGALLGPDRSGDR